jgi:hypothetical protein
MNANQDVIIDMSNVQYDDYYQQTRNILSPEIQQFCSQFPESRYSQMIHRFCDLSAKRAQKYEEYHRDHLNLAIQSTPYSWEELDTIIGFHVCRTHDEKPDEIWRSYLNSMHRYMSGELKK